MLQVRLKQALKEDLWKIINKEKIKDLDFFTEVLFDLLDRKHVNLTLVIGLAQEIRKSYDESISFFYDEMANNFHLGILKAIKSSISYLEKKLKRWSKVIGDINGR